MWQQFINWISKNNSTCPFQEHIGISCPGCGFQSSLIALLKGNLIESIKLYPALLPILATLSLLLVHINFKLSWGTKGIKILFTLSVILILFNYFHKLSI
ncbi:DUF2752 domain-containing protein [Marinifilum sp. N1E240]|uniref:DUF2752 domain-containing protein n=1 Tax=Marinifilum sp. N1E240 TaxID=2608082 RepID=UPI00128DAC82|nr:DUF2752 domain-containing protein [Marinifilum sp. N1E240]